MHLVSLNKTLVFFVFKVSTWLDKTAAASRKSKQEHQPKAPEIPAPKTPTAAKKQMSIMAFVKKKKDEALATRIMSGVAASPGTYYSGLQVL